MNNKTLFIGATHGDEPIGVEVLKRLRKSRQDFDWTIGNPKAYARGTREFGGDLNRSAPGKQFSLRYAQRRAARLLRATKKYAYTIDLHGTVADAGIFIIITKLTEANLRLATMLNIENIVYWPAVSPELNGPMSEFFPCGLEIECGPKDDPQVWDQLENVLVNFFDQRETREAQDWKAELAKRSIFEVYGSLNESPEEPLKEFVSTTIRGEQFYPLLVNQYPDAGITCYKMKRISDILSHTQLC